MFESGESVARNYPTVITAAEPSTVVRVIV